MSSVMPLGGDVADAAADVAGGAGQGGLGELQRRIFRPI
jgi:hypothetical protein